MRTIEIKIYTFAELSDKAKERAYDNYLEHYDPDLDTEDSNILLEEHGFIDTKVHWAGFNFQGAGACFTGSICLNKFLVGKYEVLKDVDFILTINPALYSDYNKWGQKVEAEIYHATEKEIELIGELEKEVEDLRVTLCDEIYKDLQSQYDNQTSMEYIGELLEGLDYEFLEDGSVYGL